MDRGLGEGYIKSRLRGVGETMGGEKRGGGVGEEEGYVKGRYCKGRY